MICTVTLLSVSMDGRIAVWQYAALLLRFWFRSLLRSSSVAAKSEVAIRLLSLSLRAGKAAGGGADESASGSAEVDGRESGRRPVGDRVRKSW